MHYLGSNSCHLIVNSEIANHIFLMKYIWACFLRQLPLVANSIWKQLIIPEYHTGVCHKGGNNASDRNSIFDVSHDYVKKVVSGSKQCFSSKCHISDMLTS